jgi:peroxiredoxin
MYFIDLSNKMIFPIKQRILFILLLLAVVQSHAQQLPAVSLKDINGKTVDVSKLENGGRPFIISFFATWCSPCLRELNAINEQYADWQEETGVRLIAVSIDEAQNAHKVKPLADRFRWEYDILLDPNRDLKRALNVQNIPTVLIIDGAGNIVETHSSYTDGAEDFLIEKIRKLVQKK